MIAEIETLWALGLALALVIAFAFWYRMDTAPLTDEERGRIDYWRKVLFQDYAIVVGDNDVLRQAFYEMVRRKLRQGDRVEDAVMEVTLKFRGMYRTGRQ